MCQNTSPSEFQPLTTCKPLARLGERIRVIENGALVAQGSLRGAIGDDHVEVEDKPSGNLPVRTTRWPAHLVEVWRP